MLTLFYSNKYNGGVSMITAIVNQKGGVAKTTTTHALATALALQGKKVLMVDLDAQSSLTICTGIKPFELEYNMYDVICKGKPIAEILFESQPNLHIAPANINLANADLELVGKFNRENTLRKALAPICDYYDHIFIDCSPSLSLLVMNALTAADQVIIPCSPDYLAYQGLQLLTNSINQVKAETNPDLFIKGIIITMNDNRTLHAREIKELISKDYPLLGEIGFSVKVKDSVINGLSIVAYDPKHQIAKDYISIAANL